MQKTGYTQLPLHGGTAPPWLFKRMVGLAREITNAILLEYPHEEFLRRLSEPCWFQAFSCVLGFDWHSSGTTTVTCGALKEAINPEDFGIAVAGGKGKASRKTPEEILKIGDLFSLNDKKIHELQYSSRLSAKVDNNALQDGYNLYHHTFVFTENGEWAVIQQGLNSQNNYARRYHWLSENVRSFVEEPGEICCDVTHEHVLNMVARESEGCRNLSVELATEKPGRLESLLKKMELKEQRMLLEWTKPEEKIVIPSLNLPRRINWNAMKMLYDKQPQNYEELLGTENVGPSTIRALALISDLVYGKPPSWKDPVKYSFAHGGKDGVPYPVNRRVMDESTEMLRHGIQEAKLGNKEKLQAIRRLEGFM